MPHRPVPAALEDVEETDKVGIDIIMRRLDRMAHAGLRGQVDDHLGPTLGKDRLDRRPVGQIGAHLAKAGEVVEDLQPVLFQRGVVIVVHVVDAGDRVALGAFLEASQRDGEQGPFGYYRITRRSDGLAIGGIGFKGRPTRGVAEVGYGLAPSARGSGCAGEALAALAKVAADHGVSTVRADTDPDNIASRRTLERAGFTRVAVDALLHYELVIT